VEGEPDSRLEANQPDLTALATEISAQFGKLAERHAQQRMIDKAHLGT
jgi:hypothetical protein